VQSTEEVFLAVEFAHKHWNDLVGASWEKLRPKLGTLLERSCQHIQHKMCTMCDFDRRATLYGLLWADFRHSSGSDDEGWQCQEVVEYVLDGVLQIMAARLQEGESSEQRLYLFNIAINETWMMEHLTQW
jgi:hypothetical protein